ncbi:MAG: Pycsar system effector family protein [Saprospiraceae bacterium]
MGDEQKISTLIEGDHNPDTYYPYDEHLSILGSCDEAFVPWNVYMTLQSSIQFADYKINLLFVIAGLILSIVIDSTNDFSSEPTTYKICFVLFMLVMLPFLYYSILTVAAHTKSKPDVKSRKLYFFGEISSMRTSEYIKLFRYSTRAEHYDELLLQVHNLSQIAKMKFKNYGKALYLLCILMGILLIMLSIKAFKA